MLQMPLAKPQHESESLPYSVVIITTISHVVTNWSGDGGGAQVSLRRSPSVLVLGVSCIGRSAALRTENHSKYLELTGHNAQ